MRKGKHWLISATLLLVYWVNEDAQAQWFAVKHALLKDVQITEETATRLVLHHPAFGISLVVAASPVPEADVYGDLEARRGGNPYRVWVATEKFWQTPLLAEDAGKKFFHASFAKTLRRPPEKFDPRIEQNPLEPTPTLKAHETIAEPAKPRSTSIQPLSTLETEPAVEIADSTTVPVHLEEIHTPNLDSAAPRTAAIDNLRLQPSPNKKAPKEKASAKREMIAPAPERQPSESAIPPILMQAENEPLPEIDSAVSLPAAALAESRAGNGRLYLYWGGALAAIIVLPLLGFVLLSPTIRARFYILRGNNETAAAIYEKLLERHPQRVELYSHLAQIYLLLGRQDAKALKVFKIIQQLSLPTPYRQQLNEIIAQAQLAEARPKQDPHRMPKGPVKTDLQKKDPGK